MLAGGVNEVFAVEDDVARSIVEALKPRLVPSTPMVERTRRQRQSQIAVIPPSTARSTPAMKLASSDARNEAVDAISSGRPSRPNGTAAANWERAWSAPSFVGACCSKIGVSIGPGLIAFTRMRRSFNSTVHVRTSERR